VTWRFVRRNLERKFAGRRRPETSASTVPARAARAGRSAVAEAGRDPRPAAAAGGPEEARLDSGAAWGAAEARPRRACPCTRLSRQAPCARAWRVAERRAHRCRSGAGSCAVPRACEARVTAASTWPCGCCVLSRARSCRRARVWTSVERRSRIGAGFPWEKRQWARAAIPRGARRPIRLCGARRRYRPA